MRGNSKTTLKHSRLISFIFFRFSSEAKQTRHPYTFLPFGQGPRQCPGQKLAMSEVKLAIIAIIRRFSLHVNEDTEVNNLILKDVPCYLK